MERVIKTIIGFDSWTEGSKHFERLVPELEQLGYRLILIHLGSWGHDVGRPNEEQIGRLPVADIAFYRGIGFRAILEKERPVGVIFFSTRSLAHQAFNMYCRWLRIPTVHLYHGLVTVQAVESSSERAWKVNWISQLNLVRTRLYKNLFNIWPIYWKALLATRAPLGEWLAFGREVIAKVRIDAIPAPRAATTDGGCVYTIADVGHMNTVYHIPMDKISVVGNPDLSGFGVAETDLGYCLAPAAATSNEVIYIDTAFTESGMVFATGGEFVQHLVETAASLMAQGLQLVVKLHPAHARGDVPAQLQAKNIILCTNNEFVERLKNAQAAMVEPSTAALIPALLGIPLLLVQYGKLTNQAYGKVLTSYPRSIELQNRSDTLAMITALRSKIDIDAIQSWIFTNSGPLPPELMPVRAAKAISAIISELSGN